MSEKLTSFAALGERFKSDEDFVTNNFVLEKDQKYNIVSMVAYLLGVRDRYFGEGLNFDMSIYRKLDLNKNARVIRNLCMLRTSLEHGYTRIFNEVHKNGREVLTLSEYIPQDSITALTKDGVKLSHKSRTYPMDYLLELNALIADRINNCKGIFPDWINWGYIREMFIMPNGRTEEGVKETGSIFREYKQYYPYQTYINWPVPHEDGNILLNDRKFVTALYLQNYDEFSDLNKVIDVSSQIKGNIYDFLDDSGKAVMIVDCENSNVYNIISMLRNLEWEHVQKLSKIILVNDVHQNLGWQELEKCTDIPIEHIMTQRVMENKSLVDGTVFAKAFMEFYEEKSDSFVLLSSDSDFWTLVDSLRNKAKFLVMVEHMKCGPDYKDRLVEAGVFYCYLDDFNSGEESEQMKTDILLRTINNELNRNNINIREIFESSRASLRIDMDAAQREQFYKKYLKTMQLLIQEDGSVVLECSLK